MDWVIRVLWGYFSLWTCLGYIISFFSCSYKLILCISLLSMHSIVISLLYDWTLIACVTVRWYCLGTISMNHVMYICCIIFSYAWLFNPLQVHFSTSCLDMLFRCVCFFYFCLLLWWWLFTWVLCNMISSCIVKVLRHCFLKSYKSYAISYGPYLICLLCDSSFPYSCLSFAWDIFFGEN